MFQQIKENELFIPYESVRRNPIGHKVKEGESCQPCQVINYDHIWPTLIENT